jgi:hypothetical protein
MIIHQQMVDGIIIVKNGEIMKEISHIILHCSDSTWGSASEINKWHLQRGFSGIGYHFIILNSLIRPRLSLESLNGSIEVGRLLDDDKWLDNGEIGAHTLGFNDHSIGICLIGVKSFTERQLVSLESLCCDLMEQYDIKTSNILGHYETPKSAGKTCPNFNVAEFRKYMDGNHYDFRKSFI